MVEIEKNGDPKRLVIANLTVIELCEGGPYEASGFLSEMTAEGPRVVGNMSFRVDTPELFAFGFVEFNKALKLLMKNPGEILRPDPNTVRAISERRGQ